MSCQEWLIADINYTEQNTIDLLLKYSVPSFTINGENVYFTIYQTYDYAFGLNNRYDTTIRGVVGVLLPTYFSSDVQNILTSIYSTDKAAIPSYEQMGFGFGNTTPYAIFSPACNLTWSSDGNYLSGTNNKLIMNNAYGQPFHFMCRDLVSQYSAYYYHGHIITDYGRFQTSETYQQPHVMHWRPVIRIKTK